MLNSTYMKDLVRDEVLRGLCLRFPKMVDSLPVIQYDDRLGVVSFTTAREGKFVEVKCSLRGVRFTFEFLDRLEAQEPEFCGFLIS